jgi:hypothetical protein
MVKAKQLTPQAICDALEAGEFYATIGVVLSKVELGPSRMLIAIDRRATGSELKRRTSFGRPALQSGGS